MTKAFALAAFFAVCTTQAMASPRAFVSGKGTDSASCGSASSPCRSPQYAHDNIVSAGGEIDILDPAGYGAITITKAISIINDGVGIAGFLAPGVGTAITINAGAGDTIVLRGLTIEGSSGGANGIVFNSGGQLTVRNCALRFTPNFQGGGSAIGILPSAAASGPNRIEIANTFIATKDDFGVLYKQPNSSASATANLILDQVTVLGSRSAGIAVYNGGTGPVNVSISGMVSSFNETGYLFQASAGGPLAASIATSSATNNHTSGVIAQGASVYLGDTNIALNGMGVFLAAYGANSVSVYSYGDNQIDGNFDSGSNPTNVVGGALLPVPQQ